MTTAVLPLCVECRKFHHYKLKENTCDVWPEGIPDRIYFKGGDCEFFRQMGHPKFTNGSADKSLDSTLLEEERTKQMRLKTRARGEKGKNQ